jgi:molecular chaperone GrpE (heat shock protein)
MVDKPDDKTATNTIVDEMQAGYMFGDTVLRPAMVVVSK